MSSISLSSLGVVEEFIASGRRNRPGSRMTPTTITIHNTDNTGRGAGAKAHSRFVRETGHYVLRNGRTIWVSWHFTVDDTFVIQHLPIDEVAYHAGSQANASSIAIEICMNPESDVATANAKAAALAAHLIAQRGLGIGALRKHKDWTNKDCPSRLLAPSKWNAFVAAVQAELNAVATAVSATALGEESLALEPHAPPAAADYEIDHEAMTAALDDEGSAGLLGGDRGGDPADVLRHIVAEVNRSASADEPRLLFPHGITEISLTFPAGGSLTVKGPAEGAASEAEAEASLEDDDAGCEAPEAEPDEGDLAAHASPRTPRPVDTQLPAETTSYYTYGDRSAQFGIAQTVRAVEAIAAEFFGATGVRPGIGNISIRRGGRFNEHMSHKAGVDVDIRPLRSDGAEVPVTFRHPKYSRSRTQKLVDIIRANNVMPVRTILFNGPQIQGVSPFSGHDNHLHVSFSASAAAALADLSGETVAGTRDTTSFAHARSGGDLDDTLDAFGFAKVLVKLTPGGYTASAAAAAALSSVAPVDEAFEACFEAPDQLQVASLAAAGAADFDAEYRAPPPRRVVVFPRLGLAIGTVSRDNIDRLRTHRWTREIYAAPELSLIRPFSIAAAAAPRSVEWGLERLGIPRAWEAGFDGRGIIVGHLDTGFDASHPALTGAVHSFAEFDLTGAKIDGATPRDSGEHGTHTAGTIAGRAVGRRARIGVAPGCKLASALVIEGGDVITRILGGLEWIVEENAKVLSMSLGLRGFTTAFQAVIDALWDNDVLPVIAVGNEFANSSRSPGNYPNVLSIGAIGRDDRVWNRSSSQLFPRDVEPLVPDLVGPGVEVTSCIPGGAYAKMSGTSMATPHVGGLAAILRQAAPSASAADIEAAILASCIRPASMPRERANRGVPDVIRALVHLGASAPIGAEHCLASTS